jgi:hypothetical protein
MQTSEAGISSKADFGAEKYTKRARCGESPPKSFFALELCHGLEDLSRHPETH